MNKTIRWPVFPSLASSVSIEKRRAWDLFIQQCMHRIFYLSFFTQRVD